MKDFLRTDRQTEIFLHYRVGLLVRSTLKPDKESFIYHPLFRENRKSTCWQAIYSNTEDTLFYMALLWFHGQVLNMSTYSVWAIWGLWGVVQCDEHQRPTIPCSVLDFSLLVQVSQNRSVSERFNNQMRWQAQSRNCGMTSCELCLASIGYVWNNGKQDRALLNKGFNK